MKLFKRKKVFGIILAFLILMTSISWVYSDDLWKDDSVKKVNDRYKNSSNEVKKDKTKPKDNENSSKSSSAKKTNSQVISSTPSKKDYDDSPYKEAIENAIVKGYASEFSPGVFKPDKKIQRKEFICMINRAFDFKKGKKIAFKDVSKRDWFFEDVAIAMNYDYIYVFDKNRFEPNKYFYRWELPHLLAKAMKLDLNNYNYRSAKEYSDYSKIPYSAKKSVAYFVDQGWIKPRTSKTFGARDILSREEVVYVLYNLQKAGKLK